MGLLRDDEKRAGGILPKTPATRYPKDEDKTKEQLFQELTDLRLRVEKLEQLPGAAALLRESEDTLRAVTDAATDGIVFLDSEGRIAYGNPAAAGMLGYERDEIVGRQASALIPPRNRGEYERRFREFVETGQGAVAGETCEVMALRKDGTEVLVELSLTRISLEGKWHAVGTAHDLTERKRLEEQLRHSQKMEAVGLLAGGIAHDFNNILMAIIGYGEIVHRKMDERDPLRADVEQILESADRAADLTRSLLAFSRRQVINLQPVDMNEVVQRMERLLMRIIGEDIDLRTSYAKDAVFVLADAGQMEQVLMNLATNARDAMPGGGCLTIETDAVILDESFRHAYGYGEPGPYAVVTVTDKGTGMDETTRMNIFKPYFTTKTAGRGTGLGLSMVYGITKQHNGYINVYSELGRGSTFRVYLPLIDPLSDRAAPTAAEAVMELPRGTETILVAEDNEALRNLFQAILEDFGYSVLLAHDGEEAVRLFVNHQDSIRLAILDMIMPRKNGKEAYEEIRKVRPGVKVIFASGYTADKVYSEGMLEEGLELIQKPVTPSDLLKKVRAVLDS
jgi:PAS domain S-box-containing protein